MPPVILYTFVNPSFTSNSLACAERLPERQTTIYVSSFSVHLCALSVVVQEVTSRLEYDQKCILLLFEHQEQQRLLLDHLCCFINRNVCVAPLCTSAYDEKKYE